MTIASSSVEAKRLFAERTDEINRRSRRDGPDPQAASELAEILVEHERECEALVRKGCKAGDRAAATR